MILLPCHNCGTDKNVSGHLSAPKVKVNLMLMCHVCAQSVMIIVKDRNEYYNDYMDYDERLVEKWNYQQESFKYEEETDPFNP